MENKEWLTIEEAIAEYNHSDDWWQKRLRRGDIKGKKNGHWLINRSAIIHYLEGTPYAPASILAPVADAKSHPSVEDDPEVTRLEQERVKLEKQREVSRLRVEAQTGLGFENAVKLYEPKLKEIKGKEEALEAATIRLKEREQEFMGKESAVASVMASRKSFIDEMNENCRGMNRDLEKLRDYYQLLRAARFVRADIEAPAFKTKELYFSEEFYESKGNLDVVGPYSEGEEDDNEKAGEEGDDDV